MTKLKLISVRLFLSIYKETAPYNRESDGGKAFSVSATRLWNSVPINLWKGTCAISFKKAIYSHF